jgi:hypothetical protein
MTQNIRELEQDIEQTRARLDLTIDRLQDRIQDKLSVSGVVDDLIGRGRQTRYASMFDNTLEIIKRNPIPVMLIAAGVGWLIHRMTTEEGSQTERYVSIRPPEHSVAPSLGTGTARVYDTGTALHHSGEERLDPPRQDVDIRA